MGDHQQMREFLEGLDREGFVAFSRSCGDRIPELTDGGETERNNFGVIESIPFEE